MEDTIYVRDPGLEKETRFSKDDFDIRPEEKVGCKREGFPLNSLLQENRWRLWYAFAIGS